MFAVLFRHALPGIFTFCSNSRSSVVQKQLMESLRKKLGVLREAQRGLQEDIRANAQLGEEVRRRLTSTLLHVADILPLNELINCPHFPISPY